VKDYFATKIETNAIIVTLVLVGLQVFILWQLNGQLANILTNGCPNPLVIGTVFGPTIALIVTLKAFATHTINKQKDGGLDGS